MGEPVSAEDFLASIVIKTEDMEVNGMTIRIQGFTKEIQAKARKQAQKHEKWDQWAFEQEVFKHGVIEPKFTNAQLDQIRTTINIDEFDKIVNRIVTLSQTTQEESAEAEATFLPERKS